VGILRWPEFNSLNIAQCIALRGQYAYPPARLERAAGHAAPDITWIGRHYRRRDPNVGTWRSPGAGHSSLYLDIFHRDLLNSPIPDVNVDGAISVVYWGYFADRYGNFNGYPLARTGWMLSGKAGGHSPPPSSVDDIALAVAAARAHLALSHFGAAWTALRQIQYIGGSFASKIAAFLDPDRCGVLDNVIAARLAASHDPSLNTIVIDPAGYDSWCTLCSTAAFNLNAAGARWTDWDGTDHGWRAIDVERVVFAYNGDPAPIIL
jgi:hypothetical protein